jgi:hypothetical protein
MFIWRLLFDASSKNQNKNKQYEDIRPKSGNSNCHM